MPFTPFHTGPGMLMKALFQGSFSLIVFSWTQIVMDVQPLIVLISGQGHLHGFTHTFIGAIFIAAVAAITGRYLGNFVLNMVTPERRLFISWPVAVISAVVGTYSHVVLDGIIHSDLEPFAPFLSENPFLGMLSVTAIHKLCFYSGVFGIAVYIAVLVWKKSITSR